MWAYGLYELARTYSNIHTKKRISESLPATSTPERENRAETSSFLLWGGNKSFSALVVGGSLDCRLLGYTGHLSMGGRLLFSRVFQKVSPISALRAVLFLSWRPLGIIFASLVTQVAVEDVHSGQRATRGSATVVACRGGLRPIYWSSASVLRPYLQSTTEVLPISMSGQHLGSVDGWLCQIFTRSLGTAASNYRASCARLGVGFLLLRRACCGLVTGGDAGQAPLRTASWGTQWGQLNWSPAATVPCVLSRWVIEVALATSFLIHSAPLGVWPLRFGASV